MMSSKEFKRRSNIFAHRRKSLIIKDIDKLLAEYEKAGTSDNRKMKCTVYIYMMCKHYLFTKPNGRRRDGVRDLMDDARRELDSPDFRRKIANKAGGAHSSGGMKKDVGTTMGKSATSLSQGYDYEGILPQKNFVQKMRLNMDSILGSNDKYFGGTYMHDYQQDVLMKRNAQAHQDLTLGNRPFSQILDDLHGMWVGDMKGEFVYLNSEQRLQYVVIIRNRQLIHYASNAPFDTGGNQLSVYAMDTDERLYSLGAERPGMNWNHSSMLSGHPVICAGIIEASQGQLKHIDNNSGHYKPDKDCLVDCVRALVEAGVDPQTFEVEEAVTRAKYATAAQFLTANGY